jgi:hypothetical protein
VGYDQLLLKARTSLPQMFAVVEPMVTESLSVASFRVKPELLQFLLQFFMTLDMNQKVAIWFASHSARNYQPLLVHLNNCEHGHESRSNSS